MHTYIHSHYPRWFKKYFISRFYKIVDWDPNMCFLNRSLWNQRRFNRFLIEIKTLNSVTPSVKTELIPEIASLRKNKRILPKINLALIMRTKSKYHSKEKKEEVCRHIILKHKTHNWKIEKMFLSPPVFQFTPFFSRSLSINSEEKWRGGN